jgi:hypothetical protein
MFFPEDEAFVEYCRTSMNVDIHSLVAVRDALSFQLDSRDNNISFFDSNDEDMGLPDGVTRVVAFKSSTAPIVILFQLRKYTEQSLYLVSADTSTAVLDSHRDKRNERLANIKALGNAIMQSMTVFNKNTDPKTSQDTAPIATLYIPPFPAGLTIRTKLSDVIVFETLRVGMQQEITPCSPRVELAFRRK